MAVIGSLLPWAPITTGLGSLSVNGTQGDGVMTLGLGAVVALLGLISIEPRKSGIVAAGVLLIGLAITAISAYDLVNMNGKLGSVSSDVARASVGMGLYIVVLGGLVSLVGGWAMRPGKATVPPTEVSPTPPAPAAPPTTPPTDAD